MSDIVAIVVTRDQAEQLQRAVHVDDELHDVHRAGLVAAIDRALVRQPFEDKAVTAKLTSSLGGSLYLKLVAYGWIVVMFDATGRASMVCVPHAEESKLRSFLQDARVGLSE